MLCFSTSFGLFGGTLQCSYSLTPNRLGRITVNKWGVVDSDSTLTVYIFLDLSSSLTGGWIVQKPGQ
jgi:hypothetical protein